MKKNYYLIANWKMNPPTKKEAESLLKEFIKGVSLKILGGEGNFKIIICPPFCWLFLIEKICQQSSLPISLGAQDVFWEEKGAYTGEISPLMLKDLGCRYVLIGHSERKKYLRETQAMIRKKLGIVLRAGLRPVLILNPQKEKIAEFKETLAKLLEGVSEKEVKNIIFVYEPTKAISTQGGQKPSYDEMVLIKSAFWETINLLYKNEGLGKKLDFIYGGSVDSKDVRKFSLDVGFNGALVGAKSLKPQEFALIAKKVYVKKH